MKSGKKAFRFISVLLCLVLVLGTFSACTQSKYGEVFDSKEKLENFLETEKITLSYPSYMGEAGGGSKQTFVAVYDGPSEQYIGYKMYHFASPFFVGVYGYSKGDGTIQSDDIKRVSAVQGFETTKGTVSLYSGKGHGDTLFLIGVLTVGEMQYECRVVGNKEMDGKDYINSIQNNNENYSKALKTMKQVLESIA